MPRTWSLENRVVLITGASRGIGEATARAFAAQGAKLVLGARDEDALVSLAGQIGALGLRLDVTSDADCERFVETAVRAYGHVDVLINNAGVGLWSPVASLTPDDLARAMDVNVYGALRLINRCVPQMKRRGGGRIVNVSSVLGHLALPMSGGYSATKFALNALTDALRVELAEDGILVSLVCPGQTATDFKRATLKGEQSPVDRPDRDSLRGASPESVAAAILVATKEGRREIELSGGGRAVRVVRRYLPAVLDRVLMRVFRQQLASTRRPEA